MPTEKPWLFRTYAGHSTAAASNALYRTNLAKGQTGLSVAFDLPTQTGYDRTTPARWARSARSACRCRTWATCGCCSGTSAGPDEHLDDDQRHRPWLLALYVAVAEEQGADIAALQGTVQNDIIKEYLSRGTYICPPKPSLRLITDVAAWTGQHLPKWNPMNVCSYHLQEAGATPEQELAFALATAVAVLDDLRGKVPAADFPAMAARISFFVNAGIRFVTEMCKMRAFTDLWDEILLSRYSVTEEKHRRFRYGVQVNSLGLTEQHRKNNVYRILLEMLAVTLSKKARARAVQLPPGTRRWACPPWDQQWSLRMQQILAYETDLLEYDDLFDGNPAIDRKVQALKDGARAELAQIDAMGGAVAAIDYMKSRLVEANADRIARIEAGETTVVGVNKFTTTEPSPLTTGEGSIMQADRRPRPTRSPACAPGAPPATRPPLKRPRRPAAGRRNRRQHHAALDRRRKGRRHHRRMGRRHPRGLRRIPRSDRRLAQPLEPPEGLEPIRDAVDAVSSKLGRRLKFLMGKARP